MEAFHRWLAVALAWSFALNCSAHAAGPSPAVDRAFDSGVQCLLKDLDQGQFGDPYLSFVYPGERLPPTKTGPLTYRQGDAYMVLALIGREGPVPPQLSPEIERAERTLQEAAELWVGRGFNNTLHQPDPDGIALDTYCMVGWLAGSSAMADEVAGALVDDRWLPEKWYEGDETFRAIADESWCVRLLAGQTQHTATALRLLERLSDESLEQVDAAHFYTAWHLGMVAAEIETGRLPASVARNAMEVLEHWADSRDPGDLLEWANLASADILPRFDQRGARLQARALRVLLETQQADGCWSFEDDSPRVGQSFLTLRALLALQRYRSGESSDRPNPAP